MSLWPLVLRDLTFHRKKTLPLVLLCGLILMVPLASFLLVRQIITLADRPLATLNTELILQHDSGAKDAATLKTQGLVEPFNLQHFDRQAVRQHLATFKGIHQSASALVLWRFDPQNTLTVVGLDPADPPVGLRKIESLLMPGSRFFSGSRSGEVILERHFAKLFKHEPGGRFTLAGHTFLIVGLVDFTEQSNLNNAAVFLPYETALDLAGLNGQVVNQVFITLASSASTHDVSRELGILFPDFSLISRDNLYKNLSAFNRLIYRGGHLLVLLTLPLALLLLFWVIKMHRLDCASNITILKTIGWPGRDLRRWLALDLGFLLTGGLMIATILGGIIATLFLPHLQIAPLLDQGFHL